MSKTLSFRDALLNAVHLRNETTDPTVGSDTNAVGSYWIRNGLYPTRPTETYLRLNTGAAANGWVRQNTLHLQIFNVKTFGAVGNGVTNDTTAIQAAITAAVAAGGGEIYFPPGTYAVQRVPGFLGSFEIGNQNNLTFRGDGAASTLAMTGDPATNTWYMFRVFNQSHNITFRNLRFLGTGFVNPNPAGQHFYIQVSSAAPDVGPPHDVDISECYFDAILLGAAIRTIGTSAPLNPYDVRINKNTFNIGDGVSGGTLGRSCFEIREFTSALQGHFNFLTGAKNSLIDCEPNTFPINGFNLIGNHCLYNASVKTGAIDLSGAAGTVSQLVVCAHNLITNGGNLRGFNLFNVLVKGNIVDIDTTSSNAEGVFYAQSNCDQLAVVGNVLISHNNSGNRMMIEIGGDVSGNPSTGIVSDNVGIAFNGISDGLGLSSFNELTCSGNIINYTPNAANVSNVIGLRPTNVEGDHWQVIGNLAIALTNTAKTNISIATGGNNDIHNVVVNHNLTRNGASGILYETSAGKVFLDWRSCNGNNCAAVTTATVNLPTTNVGVTIEATAGPGSQFTVVGVAAGPSGLVTAPVGSVNCNQSGGAATAIFYKESGSGNTGWIPVGSSYIQFGAQALSTATAARFLAPGTALAVETATEIKVPITRDGRIRFWRIQCTPGTGGNNNTFTLRKNGTNQASSIVIANTASAGSSAGTFAVAKGDLISVQVTKGGAPTTPQTNVVFSFELC